MKMLNKCIKCGKKVSAIHVKHCQKCYNKLKKGINNPNYKHGQCCTKLLCIICKQIRDYRAKSKMCRKCYIKNIPKGKNSPIWKGGKPKCKYCNKLISFYSKLCQKCYLKTLKNKGNPNWLGGKSFEPYGKKWYSIRINIRKLYNNKCQVCNKFGKIVHHINYDKKNCLYTNLTVVCRSHHSQTNFNRDYWFAYFSYKKELENEKNQKN